MVVGFGIALRIVGFAGLIIALLAEGLARTGRVREKRLIYWGVLGGIVLTIIFSSLDINHITAPEGPVEETLEGSISVLLAVSLAGALLWMHRNKTRLLQGEAAMPNPRINTFVFIIVLLAVGRESFEIFRPLYEPQFDESLVDVALGLLQGSISATALSYLLYIYLGRQNLSGYLRMSSLAILVVGAGLMTNAAREYAHAGLLPPLSEPLWNTSAIAGDFSFFGEVLHTYLGYLAVPTVNELLAYFLYVMVVGSVLLILRRRNQPSIG